MSKVSKGSQKHVRTSPRVNNDFLSPRSSTREKDVSSHETPKRIIRDNFEVGSVLSSSGASFSSRRGKNDAGYDPLNPMIGDVSR